MYQMVGVLETLKEKRPGIHPELQIIPFQHIYRMLDEGELDAVVGFQAPAAAKASVHYRELQKIPMKMICANSHALARRQEVSIEELRQAPLALFEPPKIFSNAVQLQVKLMEDRDVSDLHFCGSAEAITVLVSSGYGISVLPEIMIPESPRLEKVDIRDASSISFGIYYKSLHANPSLRAFVDEAKAMFLSAK